MEQISTNARQAQPSDNRHRTASSGAVSPAVLAMLAFGFVFSFLIVLAWVGRSSSPAAVSAAEVTGDGRPTRFSSPSGYSVEIPAGWEPVPDALLQRAAALAANGGNGGTREWEAGFQSHADPVLLRNPYVLFSVLSYPTDQQPTVDEIAADLPPCVGLDNSRTGKHIATVETAKRVLGTSVNQIVWDGRTKTVTFPMPPATDGSETIGSMHYGRHAVVVITIYGDAAAIKFDTLSALFKKMQDSFQFDTGFAYDDSVNAQANTREADSMH